MIIPFKKNSNQEEQELVNEYNNLLPVHQRKSRTQLGIIVFIMAFYLLVFLYGMYVTFGA